MQAYAKKLIFPILWELLFIISCLTLSKKYFIYTNFIFYLGIIVFYCRAGDFKLSELKLHLKSGKIYWIPVLWTALGMIFALMVSALLLVLFPGVDSGMVGLSRENWLQLVLFAISTIIFPPLAEELFFRKAIIRFDSKIVLLTTFLLGMFLYALEHSFSWLGIVQTMIVAIPLTISYVKTKNVYIPMAEHFFVNLVGNGSTVVFTVIKFLKL